MIIDGRKIADEIYEKLSRRIAALSFKPLFIDVLVGGDPVSVQYVGMKESRAKLLGADCEIVRLPETTSEDDLIERITELNQRKNLCGLIVQLPLPKGFNTQRVLDAIDPRIDVDAVSSKTSERFYNHEESLIPPTASACIELLDSTGVDLQGKRVVVIGRGMLVGKPVVELLHRQEVEAEVVHSSTENPEVILKQADVIISGIGKPGFVTADKVKTGVILIDAGTAEASGEIKGDVDKDSVLSIASFVSPVPGGVGPVTVAKLFENVVTVAERQNINSLQEATDFFLDNLEKLEKQINSSLDNLENDELK